MFSVIVRVYSLKLSKDSRYLWMSHNLLIDPQRMLKHQFTEIRSMVNTKRKRRLTNCLGDSWLDTFLHGLQHLCGLALLRSDGHYGWL